MKATAYTECDSPDPLQRQKFNSSDSKVDASRGTLADTLLQFVVRRPGAFIFAYGSGAALLALWLFIASVQNGEWIWASIAGIWLASIATCVGGLFYLLSNFRRRSF